MVPQRWPRRLPLAQTTLVLTTGCNRLSLKCLSLKCLSLWEVGWTAQGNWWENRTPRPIFGQSLANLWPNPPPHTHTHTHTHQGGTTTTTPTNTLVLYVFICHKNTVSNFISIQNATFPDITKKPHLPLLKSRIYQKATFTITKKPHLLKKPNLLFSSASARTSDFLICKKKGRG